MVRLGQTIDGIRPGWLPERGWLQQHEVAARFFEYLKVSYARPNLVRPLGEVAAELCGTAVPIGRLYSTIQFAALLRANMGPIESTLA